MTRNTGKDPRNLTLVVATRAQAMATFDKLPKAVRQALANASWDFSPIGVQQARKKYGFSAKQLVGVIKANDRETTDAFHAKMRLSDP